MKTLGFWIEAMRLRTLPVSLAGVTMAVAMAVRNNTVKPLPAVLCAVFAILAQIASNFANEYYDYKAGRDKPGREGPRRGVTEGEISPGAMRNATFATLAVACCVGLSLVIWGGWLLIPVGIAVALGVYAYSAGPWPLSTHGLGEVAVIVFFGLVPVNFTYYIQAHAWAYNVFWVSLAIGLMGANVLIVNNYRDIPDDTAVGKKTLGVRFGALFLILLYGLDAVVSTLILWEIINWGVAVFYALVSLFVIIQMSHLQGRALTPLLGITATTMFLVALACLLI